VLINDSVPGADHQYDLLRGIHAAYHQVSLILMVSNYDRDFVVNAMRYGARGLFCSAEQPFKLLRRCIEAVHHGQIWVNNEQMQYIVDALASPSIRLLNSNGRSLLTRREEQTVSCVAEGMSNRQIADQLSIKESTVKKSLLRIYDKLGISNRVELVLYALTQRARDRSDIQLSRRPSTAQSAESKEVHGCSNRKKPTGASGPREEAA
jgi:DNA-binding NarL/FixJ family response regulator